MAYRRKLAGALGFAARQVVADCTSACPTPAWRAVAVHEAEVHQALLFALKSFLLYIVCASHRFINHLYAERVQAASSGRSCQWRTGWQRGFAAQSGPAPAGPASGPSQRGVSRSPVCAAFPCARLACSLRLLHCSVPSLLVAAACYSPACSLAHARSVPGLCGSHDMSCHCCYRPVPD